MHSTFLKNGKKLMLSMAATLILSTSALAAPLVGKIGHSMPTEHPQTKTVEKFASLVNDYTDGRVKVQVFSGGTLGGDEKMLRATQAGTQEMYYGSLAPISGRVKELQAFDIPFVFNNMEEVDAVFRGPMGERIIKLLEPLNLVGLVWVETGFRNVSNNKHPIHSADDFKGLKLRVMQNPIALETFKNMGANALPMDFSEVFTALETGVIDGQENPLIHMYANKMQEVQKYITVTNHVFTPSIIMVSKRFMDKMTPEDREAVHKAAKEAQLFHRGVMTEADKNVVQQLTDAGVIVETLPPAEVDRLRAAVKPAVDKFVPIIGEQFVADFYGEVDKVRANANQKS